MTSHHVTSRHVTYSSYPVTQCAAVSTCCSSTSTHPHVWLKSPMSGSNWREHIIGHFPACCTSFPPTINWLSSIFTLERNTAINIKQPVYSMAKLDVNKPPKSYPELIRNRLFTILRLLFEIHAKFYCIVQDFKVCNCEV